jgi:NAD(P)-dependent dehydrogenase (short-subunit alcohol dehydrogenase family)
VVNNAGILRSHDLADTSDAVWDEVLGVNLRGSFLVTRAAWPSLLEQGYGRVVFTTSNSGILGVAGSSAYAASKAALWGLVRVLTLEGEPHGVNVNAVAPMAFTAMARRSRTASASWRAGEADAWANRLDPSMVSPVVAWLRARTAGCGEVLAQPAGDRRFFVGLTPGVVDDELSSSPSATADEILTRTAYRVLARAPQAATCTAVSCADSRARALR